MLQGIDDLSIEELQNQLLEIQRKIKEKEKDGLIEKVASGLKEHDLEFIHEVLAIVEGTKSLDKAVRKERPSGSKPFRIGKTEVYLRNGKVFFGIQEIKYTRMDKNGTLRISKEGKGLPPKVSSLPPHLQKVVLALPQKGASPIDAGEESSPLPGHRLDASEVPNVQTPSLPPEESAIESSAEQAPSESDDSETSTDYTDTSTPNEEPKSDPPLESEDEAIPGVPPTKRRKVSKVKPPVEEESTLPMELDREDTSTPARKTEKHSLQESLF